jgi:hypothetical protein
VIGNDVRRWNRELAAASSPGWAYLTVNVLKSVLSFGASLRIAECRILREEVALGALQRRAAADRADHLSAGRGVHGQGAADGSRLDGADAHPAVRVFHAPPRRDCEYVRGEDGKPMWRDGLTWSDIDAKGIVRREIFKTRKTAKAVAVHATEELKRTPVGLRIGPLVICHLTGCRRPRRSAAGSSG